MTVDGKMADAAAINLSMNAVAWRRVSQMPRSEDLVLRAHLLERCSGSAQTNVERVVPDLGIVCPHTV